MTKYALVGDVGGTNARLALCDIASGEISQAKTYSGLDYPSLEAVVRVYLDEHSVSVEDGCIAIACPITGDWVAMTNHTWAFSIAEMKKNLGFSHLEIINDFTAVSMAIPMLKKEHLIQFGGGEPVDGKPIAVYGAGTGLGVAHLVHVDKRWISLPGEGGHVDFAPNSEEEAMILEILRAEIGHVSAERVLSGPGLVNLYRAIVKSDNRLPENLRPKDITERALADSCIDCRRALSLFASSWGDLAASGVNHGDIWRRLYRWRYCPALPGIFKASGFRGGFEDKGRFKDYVHGIPVYLIVHDNPGLLGSGAHLRQTLGHIL